METLRFSLGIPRVPTFARSSRPSLLRKSPFAARPRRQSTGAQFKVNCVATDVETPSLREKDENDGEGGQQFDWRAQWYPVALAVDLDKRAPHAKTVMGLDVVVWWDTSEEKWRVFDDLCPHRLAPLSEGRIDRQGRLQCVYHGWCFDGRGNCQLIPQAPPDGPPVSFLLDFY